MVKVNAIDQEFVERKKRVAQISYSVAVVQQNLLAYTSQLFPSIFSNEPMARRMLSEICRHHRYLTLFTASKGEAGDKQRILTCIQLLSVQTMLMFLLALLYDVQGPSDDGTCVLNSTQIDCLSRKSVFDRTQSYCSWIPSNTNKVTSNVESYPCMYQDPSFTIESVLIIAVMVSLMVALFSKPIDMIFDMLTAPIADELKISDSDGMMNTMVRRMSNAARRVSIVASGTASATLNNLSSAKKLLVGLSTRKIPHTTEIAHQMASSSMKVLAATSIQQIQERNLSRLRMFHSVQNGTHDLDDSDESFSDSSDSDDDDDDDVRVASRVDRRANDVSSSVLETVITIEGKSVEKLSKEIALQRRLLKPCELELFDEQWGIDPTGEFSSGDKSIIPCMKQKEGACDIISQQLRLVQDEVIRRGEKLKIATDGHTGLEIMHLFVKDLLGRSTPAAIIFETKTNEDFEHTEVVTRIAKRLAMLALAGLNIFFVYFAILTGFRRGVSWQQSYLIACIIQFVVEICLNETMECMWIQCIIPMLVSDEVRRVGDSITEIVSDLCSSTPKASRLFLNAPDYLFVSTNLAKKFPALMESILIQSYFSHLPGELSKLWNVGSVARIRRYHSLRNITLLTTILSLVQYFATAPFILHRLLIRFMQPFVFGGLVLLWSMIISSPVYVALMSCALAILIAYSIYKYLYGATSSNELSSITPVVDDMKMKEIRVSDDVMDVDHDVHPVIVSLDDSEFQQAKDDQDSSSESSYFYDIVDVDLMSDAVDDDGSSGDSSDNHDDSSVISL